MNTGALVSRVGLARSANISGPSVSRPPFWAPSTALNRTRLLTQVRPRDVDKQDPSAMRLNMVTFLEGIKQANKQGASRLLPWQTHLRNSRKGLGHVEDSPAPLILCAPPTFSPLQGLFIPAQTAAPAPCRPETPRQVGPVLQCSHSTACP